MRYFSRYPSNIRPEGSRVRVERYFSLSVNMYFYLSKFLVDELLRQGRLIITSVMSYVHPITSTSVSYDMRVA